MIHKVTKEIRRWFRRRKAGKRTDSAFPPDFDQQTIDIIQQVQPYTMTSPERIAALLESVSYIVKNRIAGDIVECGVWKGGSMMAAATQLLRLGDTERELFLCDTFDGMTVPTTVDRTFRGQQAADMLATSDKDSACVWAYSPLAEVQSAINRVGYDSTKIHYVQGDVRETLPDRTPEQIALLRLDTDWYESTRHELECLFPRLSVGGVLIVDDYGHWEGARRAVDEYLEKRQVRIMLNRIDYTGRVGVKLAA